MTILHGDAREILPTLDLSGAVVITDPPWASGAATGIVGAGPEAFTLWDEVAALLGSARAVVVFQSALERPFSAPPLPFVQTCWLRSIPPGYRGRRIMGHVAFVYGDPPLPPGKRCWSAESNSSSVESRLENRRREHPCPMSLDHARYLVRWFSYGCRVVDPFAGAGTVLRAAEELGQEATGIEIDPRWAGALERSERIGTAQSRLFP